MSSSTRMTPRGMEVAGLTMFVLCMYCAQRPDPPAQTIAAVAQPKSVAPIAKAPPIPIPTAPAVVAAAPPIEKKSPHVVLHIGDSMVGYGHGLSLAMKKRFESAGVEYHFDAWTSAQVQTIDQKKMDRLLTAFKPDLVLFNLGTNMLTVPHPEALAGGIHALAEHLAEHGRECVWIAPIRPKWKFNPKMFDVLEENVAPCKYFDAGPELDPPLQTDHIHPTDAGGEQWAAPLWTFLSKNV
jgi:hypothetical protein